MTTVDSVSEMSSGMNISVGVEVENDDVRFFVGSINDSHNLCSIDKSKPWTVKTTTNPMRKCMEHGNYSVNAALLRVVPNAEVRADDEQEHYCRECGSERLDYVEQYANGREYKCCACGNVQMC